MWPAGHGDSQPVAKPTKSTGSRLKRSSHAWQSALRGAPGKGANVPLGFFPTCLSPRKPPPLCGAFTEALEVEFNSKECTLLAFCHF